MPQAGFEFTIPASERSQSHALDRAATELVVHYVGSISLWKKPRLVHISITRVRSRVESLQPCSSFRAQRQFFSTSISEANKFSGPLFTFRRTELSDFQRTDVNPILKLQHNQLCYVELNEEQLKGQTWTTHNRRDEMQLKVAPYEEWRKLITENTFSKNKTDKQRTGLTMWTEWQMEKWQIGRRSITHKDADTEKYLRKEWMSTWFRNWLTCLKTKIKRIHSNDIGRPRSN
jgi:hypothetical protein